MCQVNEIALTKYNYVTRLTTSCSARRVKHGSCRRVSHKRSAILREKKSVGEYLDQHKRVASEAHSAKRN